MSEHIQLISLKEGRQWNCVNYEISWRWQRNFTMRVRLRGSESTNHPYRAESKSLNMAWEFFCSLAPAAGHS
jgi:hypothetical protein